MAFVESYTGYFSDFGVLVTLAGNSVRGIFDDAYGPAFGGLIDGSGPTFLSATSASVGDSLTIASKTYSVASVEPDGTGLVLLRLKP